MLLNYYNIYNDFYLKQKYDISIFNKGEKYINKNYYIGKAFNAILNDEIEKFKIDEIFQINGKPFYTFALDAVSLRIINITNFNGSLFNDNEELFLNSTFNFKNNYLIYITNSMKDI